MVTLRVNGMPSSLRNRSVRSAVAALCAAAAVAASAAPSHVAPCCRVPAGTPVQVELVDSLGSAHSKAGDRFELRLVAPVIVDGRVVLAPGARGEGRVVDVDGPGIGGKPAKMVLAAEYLRAGRKRVPLDALQLSGLGRNRARTAQVVGLSGMAFAPLTFVGIVVPGGQVEFRPGTVAAAKVATTVTLPPLRPATRRDIAAAGGDGPTVPEPTGPIAIPPPPPGRGQVVFFRPRSPLRVGPWFNVRENGKLVGKLTNGVYFVQVTTPGMHTYTARLEPELKDHLTLEVDAGETYFVEGGLAGGLVIGAADLTPSTRQRFETVAKHFRAGAAETPEQGAETAAGSTPTPASDAPASPTR